MKRTLFTTLLIASFIAVNAQKDTIEFQNPHVVPEWTDEEEVYTVADVMPEFPGGNEKMLDFLEKNLHYPQLAKENGTQCRVVVGFVVNTEGKLENITIRKDVGWGCGEEAIRVIKKMPDWKPGLHRGKTVKVRYILPVTFDELTNKP